MAYRDDLETRRAHVRRLETQLEELEREEELIRSLPRGTRGGLAHLLGGPRLLVREIVVDGAVEDIAALASEIFDVDGRVNAEAGVRIWRAEPEPRPRRVEVHAEERTDGTTFVTVRDVGSYRSYLAAAGFVALAAQLVGRGLGAPLFLAITILLMIVAAAALRATVLKTTRRRARQALALEEALKARIPWLRARVAEDDAEEEEEERPTAAATMARAKR